jgi:hypothetical protein
MIKSYPGTKLDTFFNMEQLNETIKKHSEEIKNLKKNQEFVNQNKASGIKGSKNFKAAIKKHLDETAAKDSVFAEKYKDEKKSLEDCLTYIFNTVKKSGIMGWADDEIYGMAKHYYDEANVKIGKVISSGSVVVNHQIELTEQEKAEAREKAIREVMDEEKKRLREKPSKKKKEEEKGNLGEQATMF